MTRREFLDRLTSCLASLEDGERASMVEFYGEQIDDRMDDGMTEEQAVASLEQPEDIAANILSLRAEAQKASGAADAGQTGAAAAPGTAAMSGDASAAAPRREHRVLRGIGRAILGFCEVMLAIMLIPVALGAACALVAAYISLWTADICLLASSVCFVAFGALGIVSCFAAPVASGPVMVATIAFIVGALAMAVLAALATWFFGKLLVMLVVWCVRGIQKLLGRRKATRSAGAGAAPQQSGAPAKEYPSMPLPPLTSADQKPATRRGMPVWGKFAVVSAILVVAAFFTGLGAMTTVGGPSQLLNLAGVSRELPQLDVDASTVDVIDLSLDEAMADVVYSVFVGVSGDDKIHVVGCSPAAAGWVYWSGMDEVNGVLDGTTLKLAMEQRDGRMVIQNPITLLNTLYVRQGESSVQVLVPQDWTGSIVCDGAGNIVTHAGTAVETRATGGEKAA